MTPWRLMRPAVAAITLVALAASCSDGRSAEAFCDQLEVTLAVGPLFPDRTDGEPVPEPEALEALEDLADTAPEPVRSSVEVLLAEAQALVADATERQDRDATTTTADEDAESTRPTHPARADVESAQSAVTDYTVAECEIDPDT